MVQSLSNTSATDDAALQWGDASTASTAVRAFLRTILLEPNFRIKFYQQFLEPNFRTNFFKQLLEQKGKVVEGLSTLPTVKIHNRNSLREKERETTVEPERSRDEASIAGI